MLNKQLQALMNFGGLTEKAAAVKVALSYLKDCFGLEATVDQLTELKGYIPPVAKHGDVVGVLFEKTVFPLKAGYRDFLSVASKETKEEETYYILNYSVDTDAIPGADAICTVPVSFANVALRAINPCFNNAKDGKDKSILPAFQFATLNASTADGDYKVTEIQKISKGVIAVSDGFVVRFNEKQSSLVKKGTVLTVKEGECFVDDAGQQVKVASGKGVDCLEIPAEIGWTKVFSQVVDIPDTKYRYIVTEDGTANYWAPLCVVQLIEAMGSNDLGKFVVTVKALRTKGEKTYPDSSVKAAT